jgi:hypothetical protein
VAKGTGGSGQSLRIDKRGWKRCGKSCIFLGGSLLPEQKSKALRQLKDGRRTSHLSREFRIAATSDCSVCCLGMCFLPHGCFTMHPSLKSLLNPRAYAASSLPRTP